MTIETTHGGHLQEVDQESPPNDHWGDYREHQSPYESSIAAQRLANVEVPDEAHADPEEVKADAGRYAARPYAVTPVQVIASDSWAGNDFLLNIGENRSICVAEYDPYRKSVAIYNRTNDTVFISPSPNNTFGWGSIMIPSGGSVTMTTKSKIYLFTVTGYNPGTTQQVSVITERYA